MQSQWNNEDAAKIEKDLLSLRAYATATFYKSVTGVHLWGTVKTTSLDVFGEDRTHLFIPRVGKYIGLDNERLVKLGQLDCLPSQELPLQLSLCGEPQPSQAPTADTLLHAAIPSRFVDQTCSSATLALANHTNVKSLTTEIFGNRVAVSSIKKSRAEQVKAILALLNSSELEGILMPNLGLLTFSDEANECHERTVTLNVATKAYFETTSDTTEPKEATATQTMEIATLRQFVSNKKGHALIVVHDDSASSRSLAGSKTAQSLGAVTDGNHEESLSSDAPVRTILWPNKGVFGFGQDKHEARKVAQFATQVGEAKILANATGGWVETTITGPEAYSSHEGLLQGKIALVSGSAAGIGLATATTLAEAGACVIGVDINPEINSIMEGIGALGITVDLTQEAQIGSLIERIIREFGGLDIVVSNAGIFTAGAYLEDMEQKNWERSIAVNLTSHQVLLKHAIPFVKKGINPTIIFIGSRNVNAPGAGAASYSCAKAALTQLCRVAALELASEGVRVNIIHPDAVFDTKLWTKEALERSAERYGITVEQYKKRNLMKTEITSRSVGNTVVALASDAFAKTTGAQIPVDGGNDRII